MERLGDMERTAKEILDTLKGRAGVDGNLSRNSNNININAGGVGVWICATASIISFVLCAMMGFMFLDMNRKYDRTQDLLSVIYQQAPWLKPPSESEKKD